MTKKTDVKNKATDVAATVETATTYTPPQWADWFEEIGKVAGRARTNSKMLDAKLERIEKGVNKDKMQAEVVALATAGKITDMIPIARELENADTLLESLHERANEYRTKRDEAIQMLNIIVSAASYATNPDFDPEKYMLANFPSEAQLAAATEQLKIETAEKEAHDLNIIFDQKQEAKQRADTE